MLGAIVRASLAHPRIITALSVLIAALGVGALLNARLDVFPDFAPPHVLVQAEAPGLDATQVEALVTRPLEGLLAGTENVEAVRSTSSQGLAAIQVVFDRTGDPYRQRQVVTERLAESAGRGAPGAGPPRRGPRCRAQARHCSRRCPLRWSTSCTLGSRAIGSRPLSCVIWCAG